MSLSKIMELFPRLDAAVTGVLHGENRLPEIVDIVAEMKTHHKAARVLLPSSSKTMLVQAQGILNRLRGLPVGVDLEELEEGAVTVVKTPAEELAQELGQQ